VQCTHTRARAHTHTHTHTCAQSKKATYSKFDPPIAIQWINTGMPSTTQSFEPCAANPHGAGIITFRRAVQVSRIEVAEPKVPQQPHTAKQENDTHAHSTHARTNTLQTLNFSNHCIYLATITTSTWLQSHSITSKVSCLHTVHFTNSL